MKRFLLFALLAVSPLAAQQTALAPWFPEQFQTATGAAAAGYKICSYQAGTSNVLATYTDATGATANSNPVILDSTGYASIWLGSAAYKLVIMTPGTDNTCSTGSVVRTVDQVTVNVPRWISAQAYGAKCDGSSDDTTAIGTAITAAIAGGQPLIIQGASACVTGAQTISSAIQIKGPGTLKRKTGVSSPILSVSASGVQLDGVTIDCNSQGTSGGACIAFSSVADILVANSTVKNTAGGEWGIKCTGCTNSEIRGNILTATKGSGIAILDGSVHDRVVSNTVDNTTATNGAIAGSPIVAQNIGSGGNIDDIIISHNTITAAFGFCVEIGVFGGSGTVSSVTISNNACTIANSSGSASCRSASSAKACGGYSLANVSNSSAIGNTFTATSQRVDIAGIEVGCTGCTVVGNTLWGTTDTTGGGNNGIACYCTQSQISGNQINAWGSNNTAGILVQAVVGATVTDDTQVVGNTIVFPTSGSSLKGIYINCNVNNGSGAREILAANKLVGNAGAGTGITIAANGSPCPVDGLTEVGNQFYNLATGTVVFGATNFTWQSNSHISTSSMLQNNGGGTSFAPINFLGSVKINSQSTPAQPLDVSGNIATSGQVGLGTFTFATLPSCSGNTGAIASITDASVTTWGSNAAGGSPGTNVQVFCNGFAWTVSGK